MKRLPGASLPTREVLAFALDHARARDQEGPAPGGRGHSSFFRTLASASSSRIGSATARSFGLKAGRTKA